MYRRIWASFLTLGLILGLSLVAAGGASAVDANCTKSSLSANKGYAAYVLREGVGAVSWRTYISLSAADRCNHGDLRVNVGFYDANISYKGGQIISSSAQYQKSGSSTWHWMYRSPTWGSSASYHTGGHLDLAPTQRITNVRVNTYLNFGGSVYAPRTFTCNLVWRTCS